MITLLIAGLLVYRPMYQQDFNKAPNGEYQTLSYTQGGIYITLTGVGGKFRITNGKIILNNKSVLSDAIPYLLVEIYKELNQIDDDDIGVHQLTFTISPIPNYPNLPWIEVYAGSGYDIEWEFTYGDPNIRSRTWGPAYFPIGGAPDIGVITRAEIYEAEIDAISFMP